MAQLQAGKVDGDYALGMSLAMRLFKPDCLPPMAGWMAWLDMESADIQDSWALADYLRYHHGS